jgi:signal peptidase II
MRKLLSSGLVWLVLSIILLVLDRYSKIWMMEHLQFAEPMRILPFLNFTLSYNTGAAFSFLDGASGWQHYLLGGLAVVVSFYIIGWLARVPRNEYWQNCSLSLILAGALGNVWDRMLYGHVIDFIDFHLGDWHFAIFNVADSAICVGAVMLILLWLRQERCKSCQMR